MIRKPTEQEDPPNRRIRHLPHEEQGARSIPDEEEEKPSHGHARVQIHHPNFGPDVALPRGFMAGEAVPGGGGHFPMAHGHLTKKARK